MRSSSLPTVSSLALLTLLGVGLLGCSQAAPPEPEPVKSEVVEEPAPEPQPEPEPEPEPGTVLNEIIAVSDADGYTFNVELQYQLIEIVVDPASDVPGRTTVDPRSSTKFTLANTTEARDLTFGTASGIVSPVDQGLVTLQAGWYADSPMCNGEIPWKLSEGPNAGAGGCSIILSYARIGTGMSAGVATTLDTYKGDQGKVSDLAEEFTEQAKEHLTSPDYFIVALTDGRAPERFAQASCGYAVWASDGQCHESGRGGII